MLLLTINPGDEYIQIGEDIRIYLRDSHFQQGCKQVRLGIDAPRHIKIIRSNAIAKEELQRKDFDGNKEK